MVWLLKNETRKTANLHNSWKDPRVNNHKHQGFSGLLELCHQPILLWSPVPIVETVKKNSSYCNIFSRCNLPCECGKFWEMVQSYLLNFTPCCFCEFLVLYLVQEKIYESVRVSTNRLQRSTTRKRHDKEYVVNICKDVSVWILI